MPWPTCVHPSVFNAPPRGGKGRDAKDEGPFATAALDNTAHEQGLTLAQHREPPEVQPLREAQAVREPQHLVVGVLGAHGFLGLRSLRSIHACSYPMTAI